MSINQSIGQSVNQSINNSINKSSDQAINQAMFYSNSDTFSVIIIGLHTKLAIYNIEDMVIFTYFRNDGKKCTLCPWDKMNKSNCNNELYAFNY